MAKASGDEKLDGLEILSIGKLYSGPWDKKYWSSSRGKERYPYPVGYNSVRTHNGITYKMEIQEGLKGPLFMITSTDGKSCSGQTPDIAWERFQKKGSSQIKVWHGKRFSCKIDGVEFFGFKNALVQRLLRELVASISETAEQSFPPSSSHVGAVETRTQPQCAESITSSDLLLILGKPSVTRKRSRKHKVINSKSTRVDGFQELSSEDGKPHSDARRSIEMNFSTACASDENCGPSVVPQAFPGPVNLGDVHMKGARLSSSYRGSHLESSISGDLKVNDCSQEPTTLFSENHKAFEEAGSLSRDKILLNTLETLDNKVGSDKGQESLISAIDADMCAPDTFDLPPEKSVSGVLVTESHPEDDASSSMPNSCSEKNEFDSVGQDIAKSMMTLLLPRALPLLKTFSRKRKKNVKSLAKSPSDEKNSKLGFYLKVASTEPMEKSPSESQREKMHLLNDPSVDKNSGLMDPVVPDSFDNDDSGHRLSTQLSVYADYAEDSPTNLSREPCMDKTPGLANKASAEARFPISHAETNDCSTRPCHGKETKLNQGGPEGDSSKCKSVLLQDVDSVGTRKSLDVHAQQSNVNTSSSWISGSQVPVNAAESTMIRTPLTENVLCEDLNDTFCSETNMDLHSFPASKFSEVSAHQIPSGGCLPSDVAEDNPLTYLHNQSTGNKTETEEVKHGLHSKAQISLNHVSKQQGDLKLVACYVHPMPVSMVFMSTKENEIYICALCGILEHEEKILFLYKAQIEGQNMGHPSIIGHVSIILPSFKDAFHRDIDLEKYGIQFAPDAKSLVLLNSIRTPYCRASHINCSCRSCEADGYEKNAVKIVQVESGFVTVVTKLRTRRSACCILVCEPSFILAAEESGKLYLWVMNSQWSAETEECHLPTPECLPPCPVELKKVPKSAALVLGHNGFGKFCLWDIHKRILLSKFSAPTTSVQQFIPVSLFRWRRVSMVSAETNMNDLVNEIMDATKTRFSESKGSQNVILDDMGDVAMWLLISSDPDLKHNHGSKLHSDYNGCWKLALFVKNMMIMGSDLDKRAAAVGALAGHGIMGRRDGLVYMWELSTGFNLGSLHHFKGERASCIAAEDSGSGAIAIGSTGGQLLVYARS